MVYAMVSISIVGLLVWAHIVCPNEETFFIPGSRSGVPRIRGTPDLGPTPRSGVPEWLSNIGEFKPDNVILALGTLGLGLPDPLFWTPIWTPF